MKIKQDTMEIPIIQIFETSFDVILYDVKSEINNDDNGLHLLKERYPLSFVS